MKRNSFIKFTLGLLIAISALYSFSSLADVKKLAPVKLPPNANVLFIQAAKSGEIIPNKGDSSTYTLILKNVDPFTSFFTDRPNRLTGLVSTQQFVKIWLNDGDLEKCPPNVAIETSDLKKGQRINQVFVVSDPVYDAAKKQIMYTIKPINSNAPQINKMTIGYTVLFIDDFNWSGNQFG